VSLFKRWCFVMTIASAMLVGCGGENGGEDLVPATGMVKLDGKPIAGVSLTLVPQEGVKGRGGYAVSGPDGAFAFQSDVDVPGVPAGNYRVLMQKYAMPDGSPIPPDASAADAGIVNQLLPIYADPDQSPAYLTFPAPDPSGITIELKSKLR